MLENRLSVLDCVQGSSDFLNSRVSCSEILVISCILNEIQTCEKDKDSQVYALETFIKIIATKFAARCNKHYRWCRPGISAYPYELHQNLRSV